jgi:hypothetical protein
MITISDIKGRISVKSHKDTDGLSVIRDKFKVMKSLIYFVCCLFFSAAFAQEQNKKTKIMIVGTVHEFRDSLIKHQQFGNLINRLRSFQPDMICIESIPTWDTLSLNMVRKTSLQGAARVRKEKELDFSKLPLAIEQLHDSLEISDENLSLRSRLANAFYAHHDFYNAYYHWFILQEKLLMNSTKASSTLVNSFAYDSIHSRVHAAQRKKEFGNIIFPLAHAELILRLENIDERADDSEFQKLGKHIAKRLILNFKIFKALKTYKGLVKDTKEAEEKGRLIEFVNSKDFQMKMTDNIDGLTKKWVKSKKARQAQLLWYQRNERMARRILDAIKIKNPKNVIVFFGAAHIDFVKRELLKEPNLEVVTLSDK